MLFTRGHCGLSQTRFTQGGEVSLEKLYFTRMLQILLIKCTKKANNFVHDVVDVPNTITNTLVCMFFYS